MTSKEHTAAYMERTREALLGVNLDSVASAIDALERAIYRQAVIWACGNGGSACIASHFVTDLAVCANAQAERSVRAACLSDNIGSVLALGNDLSFDDIFSRQLLDMADPDDVLVAISGSGTSRNVIRAVETAKTVRATTIGLTRASENTLAKLVDYPICVPKVHMGALEDAFGVLTHMMAYWFIENE